MIAPQGETVERPQGWAHGAPVSNRACIDLPHGAVQFSGRRQFDLKDATVEVSVSVLFHIVGTILLQLATGQHAVGQANGVAPGG